MLKVRGHPGLLHIALARLRFYVVDEDVQGEGFVDDLGVCLAYGKDLRLMPRRIENTNQNDDGRNPAEATMLTQILDCIRMRAYLKILTALGSISSRAPV